MCATWLLRTRAPVSLTPVQRLQAARPAAPQGRGVQLLHRRVGRPRMLSWAGPRGITWHDGPSLITSFSILPLWMEIIGVTPGTVDLLSS